VFLPATVAAGVVTCELGTAPLAWAEPGEVTLGLRPNALRVDADGPVSGKLIGSVHRRDHVRLQVRLDGSDQVVDAVAGIAETPGDRVQLTLDPDGLAVLR
jgi:thiamine transport system ATP-binding protein